MKFDIQVPESLNEITLEQYQKYLKIQDNNEDEKFLAVKMIEVFCGIRGDHVLLMRATDINSIVQILTEMLNDTPKLQTMFKIKDTQYGFIPKLDDMSFGEYIDLDTFIGDWDNMHRAMNVLYRPIANQYGDKYNIEEYNVDGAEKMKDMLNYLGNEEMNLALHLISEENGGGINQFTHSLRGILDNLKISLN